MGTNRDAPQSSADAIPSIRDVREAYRRVQAVPTARISELLDSAEHLLDTLNETIPRPHHQLADDVAKGFAYTAYQHGLAVAWLLIFRQSRPAFPLARAALEAEQDLLLLCCSHDYDRAAAKAFITDCLDREHFFAAFEQMAEAYRAMGDPIAKRLALSTPRERGDPDTAIRDIIRDVAPDDTALALLYDVFAEVQRNRARRRYHWSGLSGGRPAIAAEIAAAVPWLTRELFEATYAALSHWSHPSARLWRWRNEGYEPDLACSVAHGAMHRCAQVLTQLPP